MTIRFVNPRPQFFDKAGAPLVKGRMFFFESGTAVNKPVFADVNETIPAPVDGDGAVPLSADGRVPEIFYSGTARVILQNKPIEPVFVQIWDIDGVGSFGSGAAFDAWNSIVEYESGAYVVGSDGLVYKSLQNNNSNNDPISSPTFWEQVAFLRTWNPNITYALGDGGVVGSDGKQYRSLQAANLNNDPVSSPTFWGVNNPFDQSLNTTDTPDFVGYTLGGGSSVNDAYDEDVFVVTLTAGSGTITLNASFDTLSFTLDGNNFVGRGLLLVASVVSPTGPLTLNGLPLTSADLADASGRSGFYINAKGLTSTINALQGVILEGVTTIAITEFDGTTAVDVANHIVAGSELTFNFSYPIA